MNVTKGSAAATPMYEDFVPTSELVSDEYCDTLLIHLPGFKKEQLRVQLTKGILRASGSMPIGDNKMRRFQKEFPISPNCETNKITARFDSGILHVKQPKLITPATSAQPEQQNLPPPPPQQPTTTPSPATQEPMKPVSEPQTTQNAKNTEKLTSNEDAVATGKEEGYNYRKMVGAMGKRLKMQRRVLNVFLAALFTIIVAIYVNNLITSCKQPKN